MTCLLVGIREGKATSGCGNEHRVGANNRLPSVLSAWSSEVDCPECSARNRRPEAPRPAQSAQRSLLVDTLPNRPTETVQGSLGLI